ncbi:ABC-three component system middle component 6 [Ureaplasma parvum]|uniref:Uncharacterized protein n=1 Tax=Ureaplasma parvum TaxID=134821 RepID=A0AAC9T059_UREPR|nr:ABC-three component system middle component 6 [Ureaplasma parvum]ASD24546.1 hypothetical protein CEG38_01345 [Ureaplasma parvum]ASD25175.1 hypothetical protein CEE64_01770 [Ureaplasma parvum]ASD28894.1 hypothetical protein CEG40_01860 [Ureaplasma parvum]ASD29423.1 hypothetical protein CEG41_01945 [Ureaplasma parvum]ASD29816.1 hypothetical protein CEG42_00980 [Ureaplasma parvum]
MLLPDNIHPKLSIYYNGAIIISELNKNPNQKILKLYTKIKNKHDMSFSMFVLSMDWLYIIDYINIDGEGVIKKCL